MLVVDPPGTLTRHWPSSEPSARSWPVPSASTPPRSATSTSRSVGWGQP